MTNATNTPEQSANAARHFAFAAAMETGGPFVVCMVNARHSDGRIGDAYIGADLEFSTLDKSCAEQFDRCEADRYAAHWRGWYRGFAGGCRIEIRTLTEATPLTAIEAYNRATGVSK